MAFMTDPESPPKPAAPPAQEDMWADTPGAEEVNMLTDADFDTFIETNPSVLVMFYAPCKYKITPSSYSNTVVTFLARF